MIEVVSDEPDKKYIECIDKLLKTDGNVKIHPYDYYPVSCPICNSQNVAPIYGYEFDDNHMVYLFICHDCYVYNPNGCEFVIVIEDFELCPRNVLEYESIRTG